MLSTASATKRPKKQDADEWLKVCTFLQRLEADAAEKGETGLAISLSKPFQRLLKYPLLFQNLLFHTDPSTFEYESTLQMVAEVETIVRSIEDEKIQKEERDKTRDVFARIEGLDLERRFDAVLLASNLITAAAGQRRAFLQTCRRHGELVVVEGLALGWQPVDGETQLGDVTSRLLVERFADSVVDGKVEYAVGDRRWEHSFTMRVFADQEELDGALTEADLRFDRWLDGEGGRWFVAVPA